MKKGSPLPKIPAPKAAGPPQRAPPRQSPMPFPGKPRAPAQAARKAGWQGFPFRGPEDVRAARFGEHARTPPLVFAANAGHAACRAPPGRPFR